LKINIYTHTDIHTHTLTHTHTQGLSRCSSVRNTLLRQSIVEEACIPLLQVGMHPPPLQSIVEEACIPLLSR